MFGEKTVFEQVITIFQNSSEGVRFFVYSLLVLIALVALVFILYRAIVVLKRLASETPKISPEVSYSGPEKTDYVIGKRAAAVMWGLILFLILQYLVGGIAVATSLLAPKDQQHIVLGVVYFPLALLLLISIVIVIRNRMARTELHIDRHSTTPFILREGHLVLMSIVTCSLAFWSGRHVQMSFLQMRVVFIVLGAFFFAFLSIITLVRLFVTRTVRIQSLLTLPLLGYIIYICWPR